MAFRPASTGPNDASSFLRNPASTCSGAPSMLGRHLLMSLCGAMSGDYKEVVIGRRVGYQEAWRFGQRKCQLGNGAGLAFVCRGIREGSNEQPLPEDDSDKDHDLVTPLGDDKVLLPGNEVEGDWRVFRACLVAGERAQVEKDPKFHEPSRRGMPTPRTLGKTWAHPLCVPEAGCVLIATDKLDGQLDFERTVILLLRVKSSNEREGPFGVILNRASSGTINDLNPSSLMPTNVFGNCHYYYGGPLESEHFLLMQEGRSSHKQFREIIHGISHIGQDRLQHAAHLLKERAATRNDFRFFVGYAGWSFNQLMQEIESGYWYVAACSTSLLRMTPSDRLWQRVLRLMGGQYAELSRKPRKDS